jgi:hypothetical protein
VVVNHASKKSEGSGARVVKAIKMAGREAVLAHANVVSGPNIKKIIAAATTLSLDGKNRYACA